MRGEWIALVDLRRRLFQGWPQIQTLSLAIALLLPAVGYPASSNDFMRRLDELTDYGDTTPAAAVTAIEALLTAGGMSSDQRRAALFAEGIILARNGDP